MRVRKATREQTDADHECTAGQQQRDERNTTGEETAVSGHTVPHPGPVIVRTGQSRMGRDVITVVRRAGLNSESPDRGGTGHDLKGQALAAVGALGWYLVAPP